MKVQERFFNFYINSSIHVALAVVSLTLITVLEYQLSVPNSLWVFIFFGAVTGYNFVKYAKVAGLHHRYLANSLKAIQIFSFICFIPLFISIFLMPWKVLFITAIFGLSTFFYAVPLVHHKNLRNLTGIKIFIVAFVWVGITVILPVVAANTELSLDIWLTFLQRIAIVVALMLPFEIRDVPYDSLHLKTLPQQIGVWGTKMLGEIILLLCLLFEFFKVSNEIAYILSLLLFLLILGGMLILSKPQQGRYFASFWIEGLPVLWCLFYLLFLRWDFIA